MNQKANVFVDGLLAGVLEEKGRQAYRFIYLKGYSGTAVSMTMPVAKENFDFDEFPPFFDGLLPEGLFLEALLREAKIDAGDYMKQLIVVGQDLVGNVTVEEAL